ncbi:Crp/Fnr family transcriptional regulator [Methylomonas sp. AM2-LC]|uniref:Crp/Fnr family transcriptional regulator n=1 Tax=Methylomonas sp. AM2-LC TaxID=3153301 RepID=UPI003266F801
MHQELFSILKKISFLSNSSEEALLSLASKAKEVKFRKQAIIITEGDETTSLYIILSGRVRVFSSDDKSKELTLLIQEAGSHFGELALLANEPFRSATVQALEQSICAMISKSDFINWLNTHPDVAISMLSVFSEKIRFLTEKVKQMALESAYERTIRVLQDLAIKEDDIFIIHNKPTDEELARMVGSQRETINKFMSGLIEGGYICKQGKALQIKKKLPIKF